MARKKLLTEGEVRQFMKLANLGPLSENYFSSEPIEEEEELDALSAELEGPEGGVEDVEAVELEDELPEEDGELSLSDDEALAIIDLAARLEAAMGGDEEGGEEELEVGDELEGPLPGGEEAEEEIVGMSDVYGESQQIEETQFGVTKTQSTPQSTAQSRGKDSPLQGRRTKGASCKVEVDGNWEQGYYDDKGTCIVAQAAPAGQAQSGGAMEEEIDQDAIVAEVARRVATRLQADEQKQKVSEELAERIFNRLTSK